MSAAEPEEFLASMNVGALSTAVGTAGRTLAVSVCYSYQPGRPADRPPVPQGRSEGPTAGIESGIVIARGDSSPRQNILFGAA
jgi:hypothetical protein